MQWLLRNLCHRIDSWDHCFKFENSGMQPQYIAVCSHIMHLTLFPLTAPAKKSDMLKIIFRNEKDDELDMEVNTLGVCHRNGPVFPFGTPTDRVF